MTGEDPLRTQRGVVTPVTADLRGSGFDDAVEIGRGGFGVVYRCTQSALDRTVAVKVLPADLDQEDRARFFREQRAMGRLTGHPHIVTLLEAGTTEAGRLYLVMPYYPLDSLEARIRRYGPLPVADTLEIGVKIAGALAGAHELSIVHRDVKPGNVLLAPHREAALTDFGIAHIADGYRTAAGKVTGSPAFTAPEVLEGDPSTPAADVYGLGATIFCALTGHAAFERHSGEHVVAQFLRVAADKRVPGPGQATVPDDVSVLVSAAMSRDPDARPTAAALGEAIVQIRRRHRSSTEAPAPPVTTRTEARVDRPAVWEMRPSLASVGRGSEGNLPLELTSFIDRRAEVAEVKSLLAAGRLVTLTGIGGVGKTRLALRAAAQLQRGFADGVWLVELADVADDSRLVDVVAATIGVRDESPTPLLKAVLELLSGLEVLLVLDGCEGVVDGVAELVDTLLRTCPDLHILVTSRERLNGAGEAVLQVPPLQAPDRDADPPLGEMARFDGVSLFVTRAAAAVPGFELDEENKVDIARICAQLDGLPLAIELAAARMGALSTAQIRRRLTDQYALLTRGSRSAPTRQQTLRGCMDWSYSLCTEIEQRMWARLSVFAGSFALDAAEEVCGAGMAGAEPPLEASTPLDVISSLVDKSIVIREDSKIRVRFRMLDAVRNYGREKLSESGENAELRRRHRDWYQRLALNAEADWLSPRQPEWQDRLEREQPNLRDALESFLAANTVEATEAGLRTAAALSEFWIFRGLHGEGRSWLERLLGRPGADQTSASVEALRVSSQLISAQGDFELAAARLDAARALADAEGSSALRAQVAYGEGAFALTRGEPVRAAAALTRTVELLRATEPPNLYVSALTLLGWAGEVSDDIDTADSCYREVLAIAEKYGEFIYRAAALRGIGVVAWRRGDRDRARESLESALRFTRMMRSPLLTALSLEALAWTVDDRRGAERAAVLMGAAAGRWPAGGSVTTVFSNMSRFHEVCNDSSRGVLGERRFAAARRRGRAMGLDAAVAYALREEPTGAPGSDPAAPQLTKREHQVAELVAQGLSNRQIAAKLVISQRTAQGHVEHILSKLAFTSRAQIAAWVVGRG
ncbi:protein kinase [Nocardia sp. NPDC050799]|uniref:protein kinase domain-containing protein n=1 Tax=Nocardia sp. NPDC050799 TaxID=3154842 RepID=UPI0034059E4C